MHQALPPAREAFAGFLASLRQDARIVVFCHFDADGLAAGALLARGLARAGFGEVDVVHSLRGESAFSAEARQRLEALRPDALIVADLGVSSEAVLPGVPTALVDHHRPSGTPADDVAISGYGWDPIPASAWLAFEMLRPIADVEDLAWLAAVGTISDLGEAAPWDELAQIRKRFTARWLKEAVVLVNAARRASAFDIDTALRLLMRCDHPRDLVTDESGDAQRLQAYREEVNAELKQARRAAPVFSATEPWALVRIHSPCQVHPLIAQQWRTRLPKYAVIAANTGYVPDIVAFSVRTARTDLNLPSLLQALDPGDFGGRFGQGHDQASGGHLPPASFAILLERLGFEPPA